MRDHLGEALRLLREAQDAPARLRGQTLARAFHAASAAETPLLDQIDASKDPDAISTVLRRLSEQIAGLQAGIAKAIVIDRWAQGKYDFGTSSPGSVAPGGRPGGGRLPDGTPLSFPTTHVGAESGMSHVPHRSTASRRGSANDVGPIEAGGVSVSPSGVATPAGSISTDPGLPTTGNIPAVPTSPGQAGAEVCQTAPGACSAHPDNVCCFGSPMPLNATTMIATYLVGTARHYAVCVIEVFADAPNGPRGDYSLVSSGGGSNCNPSNTGASGQNVATYVQSGMYAYPTYSSCSAAGGNCPIRYMSGWSCFCGGIVSNYPLYFSRSSATATQQAQSWISMAIQDFNYSSGYDNRWTYIPSGCTGQGSPNGNNTAQGLPPIINCNIASPPFAFIPDSPDASYYEGILLSTINGLLAQVNAVEAQLVALVNATAQSVEQEAAAVQALIHQQIDPILQNPGGVVDTGLGAYDTVDHAASATLWPPYDLGEDTATSAGAAVADQTPDAVPSTIESTQYSVNYVGGTAYETALPCKANINPGVDCTNTDNDGSGGLSTSGQVDASAAPPVPVTGTPDAFGRKVRDWAYAHYDRASMNYPRPYGPLGNDDCTNFISTAWHLGGGLKMSHGSNHDTDWFARLLFPLSQHYTDLSVPWVNVKAMYKYFTITHGIAAGWGASLGSSQTAAAIGDAYQYDQGNLDGGHPVGYDHGSVYTGNAARAFTYQQSGKAAIRFPAGEELYTQWGEDVKNRPWNYFHLAEADKKKAGRQHARIIHIHRAGDSAVGSVGGSTLADSSAPAITDTDSTAIESVIDPGGIPPESTRSRLKTSILSDLDTIDRAEQGPGLFPAGLSLYRQAFASSVVDAQWHDLIDAVRTLANEHNRAWYKTARVTHIRWRVLHQSGSRAFADLTGTEEYRNPGMFGGQWSTHRDWKLQLTLEKGHWRILAYQKSGGPRP